MNNYKKNEILNLANSFLEEKIGSIELSRKVIRLAYELGFQESDEIDSFKALESQTDHLPIGTLREKYSVERLIEIDKEIKDYEDFYRDSITNACQKLIGKYLI